MSENDWIACYRQCDNCDNLRHRVDLILVTDGAVDPDGKKICYQCASKQLSALRNEVRAWRDADEREDMLFNTLGEEDRNRILQAITNTDNTGALEDEFNQLVSNIEKDIANDDEDGDEEIPLEDRALGCNDYRDDNIEPFGHY